MATEANTRLRASGKAYLLLTRRRAGQKSPSGVGPGKAVRQRLWAHSKTNTGRVLKIRRWTKYRHDWGIKSLTCSSELRYSFAGFNEVSASSQRCILIDDSTELRRAGLMHGSAPFIHA